MLKFSTFHFCLRPTAEGPSNYLSYSSFLVLGTLLITSGQHFWFKSGHRPRTSPGLATSERERQRRRKTSKTRHFFSHQKVKIIFHILHNAAADAAQADANVMHFLSPLRDSRLRRMSSLEFDPRDLLTRQRSNEHETLFAASTSSSSNLSFTFVTLLSFALGQF